VTSGMERLAKALNNDEFFSQMERFARSFASYRDQLPLIPYAYTRTQLLRAPNYEIVVMRWSPGSISPIHDHGKSDCWVLMMEGALEIENFDRDDDGSSGLVALRPTGSRSLGLGDVDHRGGPTELHRVRNATDEMAYSLQLYCEPIQSYTVVDAHSRQSRLVTATCDLELLGI
jgi:predicted metal-dependent enzyme (double-stranded beta helix superfamily)